MVLERVISHLVQGSAPRTVKWKTPLTHGQEPTSYSPSLPPQGQPRICCTNPSRLISCLCRMLQSQTVRDVLTKKSWNQPQAQISETIGPLNAMRNPRRTSHDGQWRRIDHTYLSEELGNLTEPESPRIQANARNSSHFSKGY